MLRLAAVYIVLALAALETQPVSETDHPARDTEPPPTTAPTVLEIQLRQQGWVDKRYCVPQAGSLCASLGDPYRFNWYSRDDIRNAAVSAIQNIGFSVNPPGVNYAFAECEAKAQQQAAVSNSDFQQLWTDLIPLDQRILEKMDVTWTDLGLQANRNRRYRFQLFGCYYTTQAGGEASLRHAAVLDERDVRYVTSGDLILTMTMQMGARRGKFQTITSAYPERLLKHIHKLIVEEVDNIEPNSRPLIGGDRIIS